MSNIGRDETPAAQAPVQNAQGAMLVAPLSSIRIKLFGRTDVGKVRDHNEDNFTVADLSQSARGLMEHVRLHTVGPHGTLMAVCDGMGGAAAGEVASKLAVDTIYEEMQNGGVPRSRDDFARRLVRSVEIAGHRILAEARLDRNRKGMGTTSTVAALVDDVLFLAQVGDSRAYILRGDKLVQVTRDQSLVNQLIESGQLTEEEAETFEHSNIILQALGTSETVQVDLTFVRVRQNDTLLLCSDGLSGMVRNEEIRQLLLQQSDPIELCKVLTNKANEAGGYDNITVIIAKFEGAPAIAPTDEPLKYQKYVFADDPNAHATAPQAAKTNNKAEPLKGNSQPAPQNKLGITQVGGMSPLNTQPSGAGTPSSKQPSTPPAPPSIGQRVSREDDLRAAGIPVSSGPALWVWLVAFLAIGAVIVGVWALK